MSRRAIILTALVLLAGSAVFWFGLGAYRANTDFLKEESTAKTATATVTLHTGELLPPSAFVITTSTPKVNLPPPGTVRALYVSASTVSDNPARLQQIIDVMKADGLNALVIDMKDGDATYLDANTPAFVQQLNAQGIYAIARMVVFQDNALAKAHPEWALKNANGSLWKSNRVYWLDAAGHGAWDYNVSLANRIVDAGFQEINLDYVRFPSDGNLDAAVYPFYDGVVLKQNVMVDFFKYFSDSIHGSHPGAVISADVFADSFLRDYDVGIGQRIKLIAPYVDVLAPMIYPSHYAKGNFGFPNPDTEPYEVTLQTLENGKQTLAMVSSTVTVRPWIQAFSLGVPYTPAMVQAELKAIHDAGYHSGWMAWNPSNVYNVAEFAGGN